MVIVFVHVPLHVCGPVLLLHVTPLPHKSLATAPPLFESHVVNPVFESGSVPWHSEVPVEAGVVIEGAVLSVIVKVDVVELALPQSSVAVHVIVIVWVHVPLHVCGPLLLLHVTLLPHRSIAVAPPLFASHAVNPVFASGSTP